MKPPGVALLHLFVFLYHLSIITCSSRPNNVKVVAFGANHAKVKWSAPTSYEAKLTGYLVLHTEDSGLVDREWHKTRIDDQTTECVLRSLVRYYIKVKPVFDNIIIGLPSDVIEFTLAEQQSSDQMMAKVDRVVTGIYPSIVQVYWRAPDVLDGKLFQYQLFYAKSPMTKSSKDLRVEVIDKLKMTDFDRVKEFETKLFGLEPDTEYELMIKVKTSDNVNGVNSDLFPYRTQPDKSKKSSWNRNTKEIPRPTGFFAPLFHLIYSLIDFFLWTVIFMIKASLLLSPIVFLWWSIRRHPKPETTTLQRASQLFNQSDYRRAKTCYIISLNERTFPYEDQAKVNYNIALCSRLLGELAQAELYSRRTVFFDRYHLKGYHLLAETLTKLCRFDEAVAIYETICIKDPTDENFILLQLARLRAPGGASWQQQGRGTKNKRKTSKPEEEGNSSDEQDENVPPNRQKTRDQCFVILCLQRNASQDDIKKTYHAKLRECHPDKNADASDEQKKLLDEKTKDLIEAYTLLTSNVP